MKRRSFFKTLAGFTVISAMKADNIPLTSDYYLPIPCYLTMSSLGLALRIGKDKNLGRAHTLLIGPENIFPARELLGTPEGLEPFKREDFLLYSVTREIPMNVWKVLFEYGTVSNHRKVFEGLQRG